MSIPSRPNNNFQDFYAISNLVENLDKDDIIRGNEKSEDIVLQDVLFDSKESRRITSEEENKEFFLYARTGVVAKFLQKLMDFTDSAKKKNTYAKIIIKNAINKINSETLTEDGRTACKNLTAHINNCKGDITAGDIKKYFSIIKISLEDAEKGAEEVKDEEVTAAKEAVESPSNQPTTQSNQLILTKQNSTENNSICVVDLDKEKDEKNKSSGFYPIPFGKLCFSSSRPLRSFEADAYIAPSLSKLHEIKSWKGFFYTLNAGEAIYEENALSISNEKLTIKPPGETSSVTKINYKITVKNEILAKNKYKDDNSYKNKLIDTYGDIFTNLFNAADNESPAREINSIALIPLSANENLVTPIEREALQEAIKKLREDHPHIGIVVRSPTQVVKNALLKSFGPQ